MSCWYSIQSTVFHDSFYWSQSLTQVYKVLHTRALVEEYQWHFDVANWQSCDNIRSARSAIRASDSLEQAGGAKRLIYGGSIAPFLPLVIQCIICADCTHITLDTIRMWSVLCQAKKIAWEQWRFSKMQNHTIVQRGAIYAFVQKAEKNVGALIYARLHQPGRYVAAIADLQGFEGHCDSLWCVQRLFKLGPCAECNRGVLRSYCERCEYVCPTCRS